MSKDYKNNLVEDYDFDENIEEDSVCETPQSIVIDFGTPQYDAVHSVISAVSQLCSEKRQLEQQLDLVRDFIRESGLPVPGDLPHDQDEDDFECFDSDDIPY